MIPIYLKINFVHRVVLVFFLDTLLGRKDGGSMIWKLRDLFCLEILYLMKLNFLIPMIWKRNLILSLILNFITVLEKAHLLPLHKQQGELEKRMRVKPN